MRVLVACEFSGIVRDAFSALGHDAWSCDLLPSERLGQHIQGDVLDYLSDGWDIMVAFPPCTYIAFSGIRWNVGNPERQKKTAEAVGFVSELLEAPIARIALENPVGVIPRHTGVRWSQKVHPWQFGHGESKTLCLWLKGLPMLQPTCVVDGRRPRAYMEPPSADRWRKRSRTYQGIANAMAQQWSVA